MSALLREKPPQLPHEPIGLLAVHHVPYPLPSAEDDVCRRPVPVVRQLFSRDVSPRLRVRHQCQRRYRDAREVIVALERPAPVDRRYLSKGLG